MLTDFESSDILIASNIQNNISSIFHLQFSIVTKREFTNPIIEKYTILATIMIQKFKLSRSSSPFEMYLVQNMFRNVLLY